MFVLFHCLGFLFGKTIISMLNQLFLFLYLLLVFLNSFFFFLSFSFLVTLHGMQDLSSQTKDQIWAPWSDLSPPAVEAQSPNHWTTREFPSWTLFISFLISWFIHVPPFHLIFLLKIPFRRFIQSSFLKWFFLLHIFSNISLLETYY